MRAFNDHSYIQLNSKFTQSDQEIVSSASISASLGKNETEVETADRLDCQRIHQTSLRENETKGEHNVRLKSMTY